MKEPSEFRQLLLEFLDLSFIKGRDTFSKFSLHPSQNSSEEMSGSNVKHRVFNINSVFSVFSVGGGNGKRERADHRRFLGL